jgi:hypothetical protein
MIYLSNSNHRLAGDHGLREICGYPSPCYNFSFPKYDFLDNESKLGRGYASVFKILVMKKLVSKDLLRAILPHALDSQRYRPKVEVKVEKPLIPIYSAAPVRTNMQIRANKLSKFQRSKSLR